MPRPVRKTRRQWAAEISAAHKQLTGSFFKIGRTLIAAKEALPHGAFLKMVEADLPFSSRTAQMLMKIAADPRLNAHQGSLLPLAWRPLYELTKLSDAEFQQALSSGAIHPQMSREQAQAVRTVGFSVTYEDRKVVVPYYKVDQDGEPIAYVEPARPGSVVVEHDPPMRLVTSASQERADVSASDVTSLALAQIERMVGNLASAVERGDVRVDAVLRGRIRAVADRLQRLADIEQSIN